MSDGHWTALNLSRNECLKECMTHPSGTLGLSHLLIAADAELPLVPEADVYLGNAKGLTELVSFILCAAHRDAPINGLSLIHI